MFYPKGMLAKTKKTNKKQKVLIVDDSATMRKIIITILNELGFENIVEAEDGEAGIKALRKNPDTGLVLLDWNMPKKDGYETLLEMRKIKAKEVLPIVMVTTESDKLKIIKAIEAQANSYIIKSFEHDEFKERLRGIMG